MSKYLKGVDTVLKNLNKEIQKIEGRTLKGLINAAILVRRDMDKIPPLIPIDTGNLRASFYIKTSRGGVPRGGSPNFKGEDASKLSSGHSEALSQPIISPTGPVVMLGFSAFYAFYVHEMVGANFAGPSAPKRKKETKAQAKLRSRRSGAGAKFLQASLERNKLNILEEIRKEARIR